MSQVIHLCTISIIVNLKLRFKFQCWKRARNLIFLSSRQKRSAQLLLQPSTPNPRNLKPSHARCLSFFLLLFSSPPQRRIRSVLALPRCEQRLTSLSLICFVVIFEHIKNPAFCNATLTSRTHACKTGAIARTDSTYKEWVHHLAFSPRPPNFAAQCFVFPSHILIAHFLFLRFASNCHTSSAVDATATPSTLRTRTAQGDSSTYKKKTFLSNISFPFPQFCKTNTRCRLVIMQQIFAQLRTKRSACYRWTAVLATGVSTVASTLLPPQTSLSQAAPIRRSACWSQPMEKSDILFGQQTQQELKVQATDQAKQGATRQALLVLPRLLRPLPSSLVPLLRTCRSKPTALVMATTKQSWHHIYAPLTMVKENEENVINNNILH